MRHLCEGRPRWKEDRASKEPGLLSNDNPEFVTGPVFMLVEVFAREADYSQAHGFEFNPLAMVATVRSRSAVRSVRVQFDRQP